MKTLRFVTSALALSALVGPTFAQAPVGDNPTPAAAAQDAPPATPADPATPTTPSTPSSAPDGSMTPATPAPDASMTPATPNPSMTPDGSMSGNTSMQNNMSGSMNPMMGMSEMDKYKMRWAYYNLDEREVKRYRALGLTEEVIKGAANIALRTGLSLDYLVRRIQTSGLPLIQVAASYGVPTTVVTDDIPGMGMSGMMMVKGSMQSSGDAMMNSGNMSSTPSTSSPSGSMTPDASGTMTPGMATPDASMTPTTPSTPDASATPSTPATPDASATPGAPNTSMTPAATTDIIDTASSDPQFSTLVAAIKAAELVDTLKGAGPFTVFAPTNAAFEKLPAGAVDDLLKPENKSKLAAILQYHVVSGKVLAADIKTLSNASATSTVQGGTLNITTSEPVTVNGAGITKTDIVTTNGVIHVIDTVLMPPSP